MSERFYQGHQGDKKPADVRLVEGAKWLDYLQVVGGTAMLFFPPTASLGIALIASAPVENVVKNRYIDWRMGKKQQPFRHFAPQAA